MGSDLRIVEVGNNILQFKFSSRCQLEWVEKSGPWNFDNNLLLLCRWRKGLTSKNISFSHSPFWVQIWGLPFENMTEDIGKDIGSKIGRVLEVDKRAMQADLAKFLRIRVDVPIVEPLRRGGFVKNDEGGRFWVDFRYERLPTFCYKCGILGHDEKHCQVSSMEPLSGRQYGEWLKAGGVIKNGGEKEKMKAQSGVEKGSSVSIMVDGEAGEEKGAGSVNSSAPEVGDGADVERRTVVMMEAPPLNMVNSNVTSTHRKQGKQVRWDEKVPKISNIVLEWTARDGQNDVRADIVRNELYGKEIGQGVVDKKHGPVIKEIDMLGPSRIKEKEGLSEDKELGPVLKEAEMLSPIKHKENESNRSPSRI
ncbi:hypothetical protein SO802_033484 [Lithocarpus litseifolius]|uniref:CCHC-type domain-containing protein n=1 Tax=Lithocarpus litseifolius TaxID=425828 RepID=A0AAW2BGN0_9ROSI